MLHRGDLAAAEAPLRRLLKVHPAHREALLRLAQLYADLDRGRRATPLLRSLLAIQPDHAEARSLIERLADARLLRKRMAKVKSARRWLQVRRAHVGTIGQWRQTMRHARDCLRRDAVREAITAFEQARAMEPQHAETLLELGRLYGRRARDVAAVPMLRGFLAQVPHHLEAHLLLCRALMRGGSIGQAEAALAALLGLDPARLEALTMQAELETERGDLAAATAAWARAWQAEGGAAGSSPPAPEEKPFATGDLPEDAQLDLVACETVRRRIGAIGRQYTGTYEYYDLLLQQGGLIQPYERQVVSYLLDALDPGCPIVEVGCGFGLLVMLLALHGRKAVGVECDPRRAATFAAVLEAAGRRFAAVGTNTKAVYGVFPFADAIPSTAALLFTNVAAGAEDEALDANIRALKNHPFVLFDAERFFAKREGDAAIEQLLARFPRQGLPSPQPAFRIPHGGGAYYTIRNHP